MDFTQMPVSQGYIYLEILCYILYCILVMIDKHTRQIEGFLTGTEKAEQVIKKKKILLHKVIPRFALSRSLQSNNGTSFTSEVTQGVSKALGITYCLHCAWSPQSSGKVERANQILKSAIKKITQETSLGMKEALPKLSSTPVFPLRTRLVLVLMRCHMGDLLFMSMISTQIQSSNPLVLYHGHWAIPTRYKLVGCQPGPKRF